MAAKINAARSQASHRRNGGPQSLLIPFRASSRRRPCGSRLPERQIASQHSQARSAERIRESYYKWRPATGAGAMCQHQSVGTGIRCGVQEASHRLVFRRCLLEFSKLSHSQRHAALRCGSILQHPGAVFFDASPSGTTYGAWSRRRVSSIIETGRLQPNPDPQSGPAFRSMGHAARRRALGIDSQKVRILRHRYSALCFISLHFTFLGPIHHAGRRWRHGGRSRRRRSRGCRSRSHQRRHRSYLPIPHRRARATSAFSACLPATTTHGSRRAVSPACTSRASRSKSAASPRFPRISPSLARKKPSKSASPALSST
jgi:hypothetical protein